MWGCQGELWNSKGLLSDWSFAGYGAGMEKIPDLPVTVDVKRDFQAAGDGKKDDTAAVLAALKTTQGAGGVVYFPPGK
jgi:polygalacturonase